MSAPQPGLGPGPWGIYVHVPWCRRRCPYCSFYVEVDRGPDHAAYTDAVLREMDLRRRDFDALGRPSTLAFGGGTPSRLPPRHLARILAHAGLADDAEVSLEANPEDLDPASIEALRDAGITRLSIGLQTFNGRFTRLLNRASSQEQTRDVLGRIDDAGFSSWSVDLIFALPGQSLEDLDLDLDALAELAPPHVALYGLTFEPGTPFERARDRGQLLPTDDALWREMLDRIHLRLSTEIGLHPYEISNYARPGHESRHNRLYWTDRPYLGLGPSAHGYAPDGSRWQNLADVNRYAQLADPTEHAERPDAWQLATDLLVSGLRGREGLSLQRLQRRSGLRPSEGMLIGLIRGGLVRRDGERLRLTTAGMAVADGVAERLSRSLEDATPPDSCSR